MTRVTVNTARCGARRVAGPLIGGLFAFLLAGCDPSGTVTGEVVPGPALVQQAQTKPVAFQPVIGAPAKVSTKLNELLVASAGQKNIPIVPPKDAEYTVRGYLVAAADPKGTKLSYIWDVSDKTNKRKRIQGEELIEGKKGGDPWAAVDEAAMQRVAAKAIEDIAAYLPRGGEGSAVASGGAGGVATASAASTAPTTTAATTAPAGQPYSNSDSQAAQPGNAAVSTSGGGTVLAAQTAQPAPAPAPLPEAVALVPPVSGAPGDGSQSLTTAMRRYLQNAGVKLVDSGAGDNTYTVKGSVEIGSAVDGQQPITIQWMVVDPKGKTLDKAVVQRNKVAEGSLDGPWGQVADLAAGEAAKSIAKLIGKPAS